MAVGGLGSTLLRCGRAMHDFFSPMKEGAKTYFPVFSLALAVAVRSFNGYGRGRGGVNQRAVISWCVLAGRMRREEERTCGSRGKKTRGPRKGGRLHHDTKERRRRRRGRET